MAIGTRPKPGLHDRKRSGRHHRHNKSYLKHYWPYLPMLVIVGFGIVVNTALTNSAVLGISSTFNSTDLLKDTNAQRSQEGEHVLALNSELSAAAQAKADDMVRSNYWSHVSPSGKTPWSFITNSGYDYQTAGENLAYGFTDPSMVVKGWMNSAEHRANVLNKGYSDVGFGIASSPNFVGQGPETIIVAEYAQPVGGNAAVAVDGAPTGNVLGAEAPAQTISRVQLLTGRSQWTLLAIIALSGGAGALFVLRHGYRMQRWLSRGEAFVTHHPYLDIAIVFIITAGCVLSRTGGIIG